MAKRLTKEGWRALGVSNPVELCKRAGGRLYISFTPHEPALPARWRVISPRGRTDPDAAWYDYGQKSFVTPGGRASKETALKEAIKWASERYGLTGEWERDPWGDWHPAGTLEAAAAKVTEAA